MKNTAERQISAPKQPTNQAGRSLERKMKGTWLRGSEAKQRRKKLMKNQSRPIKKVNQNFKASLLFNIIQKNLAPKKKRKYLSLPQLPKFQ